jgi:hypothetical protein
MATISSRRLSTGLRVEAELHRMQPITLAITLAIDPTKKHPSHKLGPASPHPIAAGQPTATKTPSRLAKSPIKTVLLTRIDRAGPAATRQGPIGTGSGGSGPSQQARLGAEGGQYRSGEDY